MTDRFYRETWAEIDLNAIEHNIYQIKKRLPETCDIMGVVKADGYGHGAVEVARKALESGASSLAVALLEEALVLRKAGINADILVLGRVAPKYASVAAKHKITLTFIEAKWVKSVGQMNLNEPVEVHMKWDTGMGRVGIRTIEELNETIEELSCCPQVTLKGVYTHFSSADCDDLSYFNQQKSRFELMLKSFKEKWLQPVQIHIGNSAASIRFPNEMYDTIRLGIGMYGLYPSEQVKKENQVSLKQAFSLQSELIYVKKISEGEAVGYGAAYRAKSDEWIGTILIGYGDGWSRKLEGFDVLVEGKRCPIVGRICMDQLMIKLDDSYPVGTRVTLIGSQQDETIQVDDVADYIGTINYEVTCMLNQRIPRTYL